jgi:hypothetical protein
LAIKSLRQRDRKAAHEVWFTTFTIMRKLFLNLTQDRADTIGSGSGKPRLGGV